MRRFHSDRSIEGGVSFFTLPELFLLWQKHDTFFFSAQIFFLDFLCQNFSVPPPLPRMANGPFRTSKGGLFVIVDLDRERSIMWKWIPSVTTVIFITGRAQLLFKATDRSPPLNSRIGQSLASSCSHSGSLCTCAGGISGTCIRIERTGISTFA